jgi:hypothetical protein
MGSRFKGSGFKVQGSKFSTACAARDPSCAVKEDNEKISKPQHPLVATLNA